MPTGTDVIQGALKLTGLVDAQCYKSFKEFVAAMPDLFSVEVPNNISNVTVGNSQPSASERDHLWVRTDGSGSFVGLFTYAQGSWKQIYPVPQGIFRMYGDSRAVPEGYRLASADPNISSAMLAELQKTWVTGGSSPTWYTMFHTTYIGF